MIFGLTSWFLVILNESWENDPGCGRSSHIGSYLQFPKAGQNAAPSTVILYTTVYPLSLNPQSKLLTMILKIVMNGLNSCCPGQVNDCPRLFNHEIISVHDMSAKSCT